MLFILGLSFVTFLPSSIIDLKIYAIFIYKSWNFALVSYSEYYFTKNLGCKRYVSYYIAAHMLWFIKNILIIEKH